MLKIYQLILSKLLPFNSNMNNNENNIFTDIYNTINQMIINSKLNENIFEISELLTTEDSVKHNLTNDSPFTLRPNKENENKIIILILIIMII